MFSLTFKTDNAAFYDDDREEDETDPTARLAESARILRDIARRLELGYQSGVALDANGNTVGQFSIE